MKYIVDIDNTICETENSDYTNSKPLLDHIEKINQLYDSGHEIHYWTARGSNSGIDWLYFTTAQLDSWGCKYHSVKTGKPAYDIWIDDKAINANTYFK
jgi:hypothetical protein